MTQQTEDDLEEEVEELLERNLCLQDDVKQLQAELHEAQANVKGQRAASDFLAEFIYCMEKKRDYRPLQDLHKEVRDAGFRYEIIDTGSDLDDYRYQRGYQTGRRLHFTLSRYPERSYDFNRNPCKEIFLRPDRGKF